MGIISKILGSDKIVDKGLKLTDQAFFTKQEQSEHFLTLLKAYEPFKVTQRLMALTVVPVYVFVWIIAAALMVYGIFSGVVAALDASKMLAEWNNTTLGTPTAIILVFYFGGGAIDSWKRPELKRADNPTKRPVTEESN